MTTRFFPPTSSILAQWIIHGLGLTVIALAVGGNLFFDHRRIEKTEESLLLLQTRIVQEVLDQNLAALDLVMRDLGAHAFEGGVPVDLNHRLGILVDALSGVRTLTVVDAGGIIRASNRPELVGRDTRHREYFTALRDSSDRSLLHVSPPFQTSLGTYTITVGRRISGPDGAFEGIVNAALDPHYFAPLLSSVLYAPDMRAGVLHTGGTVFVSLPETGKTPEEGDAAALLAILRRTETIQEGTVAAIESETGGSRLAALRGIRPPGLAGQPPLAVFVSRDMDIVFAGWRKNALVQGGLLAVVVLFSSLLLVGFQRRQRASDRQIAQAAQALAERERFIRTITDSIPGMVAYWNADMRCEYANKAYLEWFGRTGEQMRGISIRELMGQELFVKNEAHIRAALRGEPQVFERTLQKADGSAGYTLARYIPDVENGTVRGFYVLVSDVTELKNTQAELERRVQELAELATTDPLTGIGNRRHFLERAAEEFARGRRYGHPLTFVMIDVDHFKAVNDTHGHETGDRLLTTLAATLRDTLRDTDVIGRLGGEEFGALLIQNDEHGARAVAERLHDALRRTCVAAPSGAAVCFTVSMGLAHCTPGESGPDSVEELMRRADAALYLAKAAGRDRIRRYADTMGKDAAGPAG